jgi:hypothetical protein
LSISHTEQNQQCLERGNTRGKTLTGSTEKDDAPLKIITRVVWPKDKDGYIVYPSWWRDEQMMKIAGCGATFEDSGSAD